MPGAFDGINMATTALWASQQELDVTGDNVANVNTPGYSEQAVTVSEAPTSTYYSDGAQQQQGSGVTVDSVNRVRSALLDAQMNSAQSTLGTYTSLSGNLQQVASVLNDTNGTGIGNDIDQFFNAWSALGSNPNSAGATTAVQQAGLNLTQDVQSAASQLNQLSGQANGQVQSTISQVNTLAKQIAGLNSQIVQAQATGESPNSLLDQRTQALSDLANLVNIQTNTNSDGSVSVNVSQFDLVDQGGAKGFPTTYNAANGTVGSAGATISVTGGQLSGLFQSINAIQGDQTQLDTIANTLTTQVNGLSTTGKTSTGTTGVNFFDPSSTGAATFQLSSTVAANASSIAAGTSGNSGDGSLALKISNLQSSTTLPGLGGQTISGYYQGLIGQVGSSASTYQNSLSTQQAVITQITGQISTTSGVDLDTQMADMLKYQQSYSVAARALSIFQQTTEDLLTAISGA